MILLKALYIAINYFRKISGNEMKHTKSSWKCTYAATKLYIRMTMVISYFKEKLICPLTYCICQFSQIFHFKILSYFEVFLLNPHNRMAMKPSSCTLSGLANSTYQNTEPVWKCTNEDGSCKNSMLQLIAHGLERFGYPLWHKYACLLTAWNANLHSFHWAFHDP